MVSNELSKATRELESTFNKKIERVISLNRSSIFKSQKVIVPHNFQVSDSVKNISPDSGVKVNFFSWVRNRFFGR